MRRICNCNRKTRLVAGAPPMYSPSRAALTFAVKIAAKSEHRQTPASARVEESRVDASSNFQNPRLPGSRGQGWAPSRVSFSTRS